MAAATGSNSLSRIAKTIRDPEMSLESRTLALTSLRRTHLKDPKALDDERFCELCNSIIAATMSDDERFHIEACRTLDIILPETKNRKFDFFQSISQISRKKRLKILVSLSLLKDETVATTASKLSILDFLSNCMLSVEPKSMPWLSRENADNAIVLQNAETKALSENEDLEEKIVDGASQLLARLCSFTSLGLSVSQFDTFIMEKVVPLAYMGHRKQRSQALKVMLQAVKNDMGLRVRSLHKVIWDDYKATLQNVYCERMLLLVKRFDPDWSTQWETSITLIGTDLHKGSGLVNSLLKVEEAAFKSADKNRSQAFLSWKLLVDNFALDQKELATNRRIKLLLVPLNAKNSKTDVMVFTKLEVWWHLIYKVYPSIGEHFESVLVPFLNMCFGPFGDKPLFIQKTDSNVALGKKFYKSQLLAIDAFIQLVVNKEDREKISLNILSEKLPHSINSSIFERLYKVFIHCFGEALVLLSFLPDNEIKYKSDIPRILWNNIIKKIEEYDKLKVPMYKEVTSVIVEMMKHNFHKFGYIKNFLVDVVLKNIDNVVSSLQFTENTLIELVQTFLQTENSACFTSEHYKSMETLLWHLVKPKNSDVYHSQTMELLQGIVKILDDAQLNGSNLTVLCEIWCILARIAKKYIEDSQSINEGTLILHDFRTIESIVAFPFMHLHINDPIQLKITAETWVDFYKQFDFQAELIVTVKPNEILSQISNMIITALKRDNKCCNLAAVCIDGLISAVNYDELPSEKEIPSIVMLLRELILQSLKNKSFASDRALKALSAFLLRVFSHSIEKTAAYLKVVEPAVNYLLSKVDDNELENEIVNTWKTIVGLFKKLHLSLNYEMLNCYKKTLIAAMLHLNRDISSATFSILDMKDTVDENAKKVLEDIIGELEQTSVKNNCEFNGVKEKSKKAKNTPIKQVGSFLNRKNNSPSRVATILQNGKENINKTKVINIEPDSQDFVSIENDVQIDVNRLTDHQKEMLKKRRDDIPAMYNELTVSNSQDTQELQHWFDAKAGKSPSSQTREINSNNNEEPKTHSSTSLHFKNIIKAFPNDQQKKAEKDVLSLFAATSPKNKSKTTAKSHERLEELNDASTIEDSQKNLAPVVIAKKLDFESQDEFPAEQLQIEQISPSIIENAKMRRKSNLEHINSATGTLEKSNTRTTRRSLQPQSTTLRKYNSTDQLSTKRGKKRRNSDCNSESMLNIDSEKKARRDNSPDIMNSSGESNKSNEENKIMPQNAQESGEKKISKRQKNEMSRLKIDMRFEPLPNRRSLGKSKEEMIKEEKQKEESQNSLQQTPTSKRRSMKGAAINKTELDEKELQKKDAGSKKVPEITINESKVTTRKLIGKSETVIAKKTDMIPETQEKIDIEDASTQFDLSDKIQHSPVTSKFIELDTIEETQESEIIKSSQDPDIVESSQEPTNLRSEKTECFIKITKVEMTLKSIEEEQAKDDYIIEATQTQQDPDEIVCSVIMPTAECEKSTAIPADSKRAETPTGKSTTLTNHTSSPRSSSSRAVRSKAFPLQGRAAQMLGLVTKQSIAEKLASDSAKGECLITDEVTIVPLTKKDRTPKDSIVSSPSSVRSRQEKMFNNMNNSNIKPDRCASPSMSMFKNLRNDGEKISPKLEKDKDAGSSVMNEKDISQDEGSPGKVRKELPLLEWSNANPPSLTASPSASILKRRNDFNDIDTPNRNKRVSFADPPVSREMGYEIMSESSSPPRLEKLPTNRSPISRKDSRGKQHARLRLIQIATEEVEKENEVEQMNVDVKPIELTPHESTEVFTAPKVRLTNVLLDISTEEKIIEVEDKGESEMFTDNNVSINDESIIAKTSTQNDQHNSSIKLDSINLSNINKSDVHHISLEDTVNVENASSSIENISDNKSTRPTQEPSDTLPVTDSVFSNLPMSQETQNSVAQLIEPENLDSTLPVYPSLISCADNVERVSSDLVDPLFTKDLQKHLSVKSIHSIGDLAQLTERDINRLPIKSPKIACVKKALTRYEEKVTAILRSPEKRPSNVVSSSTPLGNRRSTRSKQDDSFDAIMKNATDNSDLVSTNVSALINNKRALLKRQSIDNSMQTSPVKRTKRGDEKNFMDLMDQCDDTFLFNAFIKRFDAETILKAYKDKANNKPKSELKKEALSILGLSVEDDSEASFRASTRTAGLHQVLKQLPNIFDNEDAFYNTVLNTYKNKLEVSKVLNVLKIKEVKEAVTDKFSSAELLHILAQRLQTEKEPSEVSALLNRISADTITEHVRSRDDLSSAKELFNILLQNNMEKQPNETQAVISKIMRDKFDTCKLIDFYSEAIKSKVRDTEKK